MAITGKLLGALIGSIGGPLGTIIGGLIGHLIDRAAEDRQFLGPAQGARIAAGEGAWPGGASPVSQAQISFLTCLIGLSLAVAQADGPVKVSHVEAMKSFFRRNFSFPSVDQDLLQRLIDEMYRNRERIDIEGLCSYYAAVSALEGRMLLVRLLFQIAVADGRGVSPAEESMARRISRLLGIGEPLFRQVRAEFMQESGGAWEVLGISPEASINEVKAAYRQLSLQNHPDRVANLGPEFVKVAEEKFKAIQAAYEEVRRVKGF